MAVTQASYFAMKSSHSGTPILSPPAVVVGDVVVAGVVVVVVVGVVGVVVVVALLSPAVFVVVVEVFSVPPHPAMTSAKAADRSTGINNFLSI